MGKNNQDNYTNGHSQNPFVTNSPVRGQDFFGRKKTISDIILFLKNKHQINFLIYGQRRIGKTTLLKKIQYTAQSLQLAHPVYFNVQDKSRTPLPQLLLEIVDGIYSKLDLKLVVNQEDFHGSKAVHYFKEYFFPTVMDKIDKNQPNQVLLLLFDEFDVLAGSKDIKDIDDSSVNINHIRTFASKSFIPFIVRLSQEIQEKKYPVKFIFAVGSHYKDLELKRLRQLKKFGPGKEISYFTKKEMENLLKTLSDKYIPFEQEAIDGIYALTSGHPYFTQCLAKASFSEAEKNKRDRITLDMVKQQLNSTIKSHSSSVYWVWNSFSVLDRIILYLIAMIKEENRPVTLETLREKATAFNILPAVKNLSQILEKLKTFKFIKDNKKGEYDFYVEFIRKWIVLEVSYADIARQPDEIVMNS